MNIWLLNHYADDPSRPVTRPYDMGKILVAKGHSYTIFASSFHHYRLKELRLKPGEKWKEEVFDGVRFIWIGTTTYEGNDWRRLVNVLVYSWRAVWVGWRLPEKPDVIIGTCAHALAPLSAFVLSKLKGSRFIYEVADLWPETLIDMGALSGKSPVAWFLRQLERFLFKRAYKIISFLPGVKEYVSALGLPAQKVVWIPNGVDLDRFKDRVPYSGGEALRFTVMYVGGHARYHRLETALQAAQILQQRGRRNIRFVFVGDGAEKPKLVDFARRLDLRNVEFRGLVPKNEVVSVLNSADALLFCFQKMEVLKFGTSPIKIFDYLCSGRPIIYAHAASNSIVEDARAGITIAPEDPQAMAEAISKLVAMSPEERRKMGQNGLEYVKQHHDVRLLANQFEAHLRDIVL